MLSSFPNQEGTSPPEAAIEATPETTPVKDSRHYITPRPPPVNSTVVRALNNLGGPRPRSSTSSTPSQSQPSSPMKKEVSPFRFPESHALLDLGGEINERRKESVVVQKINSLFQDRLNVSESSPPLDKTPTNMRSPAKVLTADADHSRESNNGFKYDECTQEDQEVLEISQQGEQLRINSSTTSSASVRKAISNKNCKACHRDFLNRRRFIVELLVAHAEWPFF